MRHRWTQLHHSQWPEMIRVVIGDEKREFCNQDYQELWIHQIGYYLMRWKHWKLISPARDELIADWNFRSTKKNPPFTEANRILSERLFGMKI